MRIADIKFDDEDLVLSRKVEMLLKSVKDHAMQVCVGLFVPAIRCSP